MRRWLLVLLLFALPLQWSWAAAAPYCGHEAAAAPAAHPGHHAHEHAGDGNVAQKTPASANDQPSGADDADCIACHGGTLQGTVTTSSEPMQRAGQRYPASPEPAFAERHLQEIERPKWRDTA